MERWERPPPRRGRNNPSFSSSLLDAMYRSIDESDGGGGGPPRDHSKGGAPDPCFSCSSSSATAAAGKKQSADGRRWTTAAVIRRGSWDYSRGLVTPTSSSSDSSSYGGFSSSSDAESAASCCSAGVNPARSDRIRADPEVPPEKKKKNGSFRSRLRDLRKGRAPTSPGARLVSFLNALFAAAGNPRKPKISAPPLPESACSSASSCKRSCLSKAPTAGGRRTPSVAVEGGKRSVRFCPVSVIVGEDSRPCGHRCLHDADQAAAAAAPPPPRVARRVAELLRGLDDDDDDDDEEEAMSDSSSDLFELENLTAIGRYPDELPVYETTDLGTNHAIAQGLVV